MIFIIRVCGIQIERSVGVDMELKETYSLF